MPDEFSGENDDGGCCCVRPITPDIAPPAERCLERRHFGWRAYLSSRLFYAELSRLFFPREPQVDDYAAISRYCFII